MYYFLFLVVVLTPVSASGFFRAKTCLTASEHLERLSANARSNTVECLDDTVGKALYWKTNILTYKLHSRGLSRFPGEEGRLRVIDEIRRSFEPWMGTDCGSVRFQFDGLTTSFGHKKNRINWIGFYDEEVWPYSTQVVAVTTLTTLTGDNAIIDADIEINSRDNVIGFDGAASDYDLRNLLTHEIGHFIGLDHSGVFDATMELQTDPGQIKKRDLDPDDVAGLCEIFPADFVSVQDDGCCSTLPAKKHGTGWVLFAFLAIIAIRRRV